MTDAIDDTPWGHARATRNAEVELRRAHRFVVIGTGPGAASGG